MIPYLCRIAVGLFLGVALSISWTPVLAAFPATPDTSVCTVAPCYKYQGLGGQGSGAISTSQVTACQSWMAAQTSYPGSNTNYAFTSVGGAAGKTCYAWITRKSDGYNYGFTSPQPAGDLTVTTVAPSAPAYTCPSNATVSGSTCTCNAGYGESGSTCVSQQELNDKACKALADGLNLVGAPLVHYGSVSTTACFGGYVIGGTGAAGGGGQTELYGPFKCTGTSASTCTVVPKPAPITQTCAAGTFPGTINGVPVCVPSTTSIEAPETTTTAPPAGGGTAPPIPGAPAGTTTQETQTTCDGPTCTTSTNYKDNTGAITGTKTEAVSKASYCAENPKAPGCDSLEASTFSGNCDGGFTFKGDAIQGALAKEVHKQNCLMNKVTDESAKYDAAKVKTGDQTIDLPGNEIKAISAADIDQTNAIVGGTCIADRTININVGFTTSTLVLPFSSICPLLDYFRLVLIALGFFIAYRIIGGR